MYSSVTAVYSIGAAATGGRNGHTETTDHLVAVDLATPKEMGGPGLPGRATPEHLFAAGYAACFCGAIEFVQAQMKKNEHKPTVTSAVGIGAREAGGFGVTVKLRAENKGLPQAEFEAIVKKAHDEICPYSHATRGNISVDIEVVGA